MPQGGFRTPLGTAAVDEALAADIMKRTGFGFVPEAHAEEHSLEVQVPFVQTVLPGAKIVPIVMGYPDKRTVRVLADAMEGACRGRKVLVVASTDMSHFLAKDKANALDAKTIELIKALKADEIESRMEGRENILCGGSPVAAAILYARKTGRVRAEILDYADSAAGTGDTSRVVGYVSAAIVAEKAPAEPDLELSADERKELLGLARSAVERFVADGRVIEYSPTNPDFLLPRGLFVTLKAHGRLRGCIGFIEPVTSVARGVVEAAIYAAVRDNRFEPVSKSELGALSYEISILTPLADVADTDAIKVGRDGLIIEMAGRRGLLLPQVPTEFGWGRQEFLEQVCLKAGLPRDAWKKGAKLQRFEALVFGEED